ncbi:MAG TPA: NAD(P)H-binding protein [Actinocrinis sp.]|nr:NAD(P)H-binding protein [Actinocrinis sp.]
MELTVIGASGATGREIVRQALDRGHRVTAVLRDPARLALPETDALSLVAADVRDPDAIARALKGGKVVLSGLGVAKGDQPGVLSAGARAAVAAGPDRIVWIGAFGTGASAQAAGALTRNLLRMFMGAELTDKVASDTAVLQAGGTVFHAGPLANRPLSQSRRAVTLDAAPHRLFPAGVARANVAAAMLDEAESGAHPGQTLIPLDR